MIRLFTVLLLLGLPAAAAGVQPLKVALLVPGSETHAFWHPLVRFASAAAEDLDITLTAEYASENTYSIKKSGLQFLKEHSEDPDYLIAVYIEGVTDEVIGAALDRGIRVFLLNTDVPGSADELIGKPRQRYKNWIAHMMPNDVQAGGLLAERLIGYAHKSGKQDVEVIALNGSINTTVSEDRARGLRNQAAANTGTALHEVVDCDWSPITAASRTEALLDKYPRTSIIWAASDAMALSGAEVAGKTGKTPGEDVFVGGIDWSSRGIQAVADGTLATTIGGHFMDGAWALVLIRDYHEGLDFEPELGTRIMTSMQAITPDNAARYLERFGERNWSIIDFSRFSKSYNKSLKKYDFSLDNLL